MQTLNCGLNPKVCICWGSADLVISLEHFSKKVADHFDAKGFRVGNRLSRPARDIRVPEVWW